MKRAPLIIDGLVTLYAGDAREVIRSLPADSVDCIVTSPPYWKMRDYAITGQLGWEDTVEQYAANLVGVFTEALSVLREDGVLWLNLADKHVQKQLIPVAWTTAFAMKASGWRLAADVIWHKPNAVPPPGAKVRPGLDYEHLFMFTRSRGYRYYAELVKEPAAWERWGDQTVAKYEGTKTSSGWMKPKTKAELTARTDKYRRSVWSVPTANYKGAHDAVYPEDLIEPCIIATSPEGGVVLDPFIGSGTTAAVAVKHGRRVIGIDLDKRAVRQAAERVARAEARRA